MRDKLQHVLGDGREWEYRRECRYAEGGEGECACGQKHLKYLYTIHHPDGRAVDVGSTCILQYDEANPEMAGAISADARVLQREVRERHRREKTQRERDAKRAKWRAAEQRLEPELNALATKANRLD